MEEVLLSIVEALDLINAGILSGIGLSWGIVLGWVAADLGSKLVDKDCAKCKSPVLAGITRAEAVEIMAKEIFKAEICEGSGFNVKPSDF